jgi:hypothetical protein
MSSRRASLVMAVLLVPAVATADDHWFDAYAGPSASYASWIAGGQVTLTVPVPLGGEALTKPNPFNIVVDFSVANGTHDDEKLTQSTALVGVRWTFIKKAFPNDRKVYLKKMPFAYVMTGQVWRNGSRLDGGHTPLVAGVGWEVVDKMEKRVVGGVRVQADAVWLPGADVKRLYPRISFGAVFRIEKMHN